MLSALALPPRASRRSRTWEPIASSAAEMAGLAEDLAGLTTVFAAWEALAAGSAALVAFPAGAVRSAAADARPRATARNGRDAIAADGSQNWAGWSRQIW